MYIASFPAEICTPRACQVFVVLVEKIHELEIKLRLVKLNFAAVFISVGPDTNFFVSRYKYSCSSRIHI